eukprot:Hpha_TRINITY_DN16603_c3_g7::TRINITY_DN16603_c3_g7_i1::g.183065::m.183065
MRLALPVLAAAAAAADRRQSFPLLVPAPSEAESRWQVPVASTEILLQAPQPLLVVAAVGSQRAGLSSLLNTVLAVATGVNESECCAAAEVGPLPGFASRVAGAPLAESSVGLQGMLVPADALRESGVTVGLPFGSLLLVECESLAALGRNSAEQAPVLAAAVSIAGRFVLAPAAAVVSTWVQRLGGALALSRLLTAAVGFAPPSVPALVAVFGGEEATVGRAARGLHWDGSVSPLVVPSPAPAGGSVIQDVCAHGLRDLSQDYVAAARRIAVWALEPAGEEEAVLLWSSDVVSRLRAVASAAQVMRLQPVARPVQVYSAVRSRSLAEQVAIAAVTDICRFAAGDGHNASDQATPPTGQELRLRAASAVQTAEGYLQLRGGWLGEERRGGGDLVVAYSEKAGDTTGLVGGWVDSRFPECEDIRTGAVVAAAAAAERKAAEAVDNVWGELLQPASGADLKEARAAAEGVIADLFVGPLQQHSDVPHVAEAASRLRARVVEASEAAAATSAGLVAEALSPLTARAVGNAAERLRPDSPPVSPAQYEEVAAAVVVAAQGEWEETAESRLGSWVKDTKQWAEGKAELQAGLRQKTVDGLGSLQEAISLECTRRAEEAEAGFGAAVEERIESGGLVDPRHVSEFAREEEEAAKRRFEDAVAVYSATSHSAVAVSALAARLRTLTDARVVPGALSRWREAFRKAARCAINTAASEDLGQVLRRKVSLRYSVRVVRSRVESCLPATPAVSSRAAVRAEVEALLSGGELHSQIVSDASLDLGWMKVVPIVAVLLCSGALPL